MKGFLPPLILEPHENTASQFPKVHPKRCLKPFFLTSPPSLRISGFCAVDHLSNGFIKTRETLKQSNTL